MESSRVELIGGRAFDRFRRKTKPAPGDDRALHWWYSERESGRGPRLVDGASTGMASPTSCFSEPSYPRVAEHGVGTGEREE